MKPEKIEIHGNIYEVCDITDGKVYLQSVNDDYHMDLSSEEFCKLMKNRIKEIDKILDDESISDDEFQDLTDEAKYFTALLGKVERAMEFSNVKEIKPNEWTANFLNSFGAVPTTHNISVRQYETFRKFNNGDSFKYNGLRYDFGKGCGNYATLVISKL
jgi:hypothetical protein